MLKLAAAHVPEIAKLMYWLYEESPDLVTDGKKVMSDTGV